MKKRKKSEIDFNGKLEVGKWKRMEINDLLKFSEWRT